MRSNNSLAIKILDKKKKHLIISILLKLRWVLFYSVLIFCGAGDKTQASLLLSYSLSPETKFKTELFIYLLPFLNLCLGS
jgi:hypothetical protein